LSEEVARQRKYPEGYWLNVLYEPFIPISIFVDWPSTLYRPAHLPEAYPGIIDGFNSNIDYVLYIEILKWINFFIKNAKTSEVDQINPSDWRTVVYFFRCFCYQKRKSYYSMKASSGTRLLTS